jgi:hypothetical protein
MVKENILAVVNIVVVPVVVKQHRECRTHQWTP